MEIREINYDERVVVTEDEQRLPIVDLFDAAGLPTEEPRQAVLGIACGEEAWIFFQLKPFTRSRLQ
ncbi:MAG: hypothetical protein JO111_08430 [Caulobacteraceae bacterium]|nr:hypothetical protein [Caulobacteraceae bacterium]